MSYKDEMALKAQAHTKRMEDNYSDEIKECIDNSIIYDDFSVTEILHDTTPKGFLRNCTTTEGIFDEEVKGKVAVLNFASFKSPGGNFINGSMAQEEAICHDSFLYNVLKSFATYYERNLKNLNRGLYTNRAIYSPKVKFFYKDMIRNVDVITCASPNWMGAERCGLASYEENCEVLRDRIKFVLDIAYDNEVETLILGAFGCGVFKQDAKLVAKIFKELIPNYNFKKVIMAVPKGKNSYNYNAFEEILLNS